MRGKGREGAMSSNGAPPWLLYGLIIMLSSYVVIDIISNTFHPWGGGTSTGGSNIFQDSSCPPPLHASSSLAKEPEPEPEPPQCRSLEGHMEEEEEVSIAALASELRKNEEDAWRQMKWTGRSAACRVKGHLIEKLEPENNFRRGFALGFADDVEDKTHLLPWLLATRADLSSASRRVYLDLGANAFSTSIAWFLRMYPCDFTEVHAFEIDPALLRVPPNDSFSERSNYAGPNAFARRVKSKPGVPPWMLPRIHVYNALVSEEDSQGPPRNKTSVVVVDITRFIKEELRLSARDTVVVKMDIEGSEWPILRHWMNDPDMAGIVDELFVEVHYDHPSMHAYHWARFAPTTRDDAFRFLAELRWHGFFVHPWP